MNAITVCVEYDDLLAITLRRNRAYFDRFLIVTSPADQRTRWLAAHPSRQCEVFLTDAFYRRGADFNKGLAIEEAFDVLGREGWICVLDADVMLPHWPVLWPIQPGNLYSPFRRQLDDPREWSLDLDWRALPLVDDREFAGYCQVFHASDPAIANRRPWYGTDWRHAGGCDSDFQAHWPADKKLRLPFEVLHIGKHGQNWHGRWTRRLDDTIPAGADQRWGSQMEMVAARAGHYTGYKGEKLS